MENVELRSIKWYISCLTILYSISDKKIINIYSVWIIKSTWLVSLTNLLRIYAFPRKCGGIILINMRCLSGGIQAVCPRGCEGEARRMAGFESKQSNKGNYFHLYPDNNTYVFLLGFARLEGPIHTSIRTSSHPISTVVFFYLCFLSDSCLWSRESGWK